jgi:uncharacterized protein (TIGR00730 family)
MTITRVCVYCASSRQCDPDFFTASAELGRLLAQKGITLVYGGGRVGLMGAIADAAVAAGGEVMGVIPEFMKELEWGHEEISELVVTDDMHTRKNLMIESADAIVALPGGCGTLEELMEALTWKRLALHHKPIVIANLKGYYDPLLAQLEACIDGKFMRARHAEMWTSVREVADILPAIENAIPWDENARDFAGM